MAKNQNDSEHKQSISQQPHSWKILLGVLLLGLLLRFYHISNPALDWHSFRQADTVSVTREYVKHGIDILRPRYHDLSNIQSGKNNLEGYRMVEFPIVNAMLALLIRSFPMLDLELTSRLSSVAFSCISLILFYDLIRRLFNRRVALASMLSFAVMPYAAYYSRVILPEPYLLTAALSALWFFTIYHQKQNLCTLLGFMVSLSLAMLLKPFVVFYLPIFAAIHFQWLIPNFKLSKLWQSATLLLSASLALVPLWWWRNWILQFPSGIPAADWLFNSNGIRWRPAWFRWLGYERLTKIMVGYTGLVLLGANFLNKNTKEWILLGSWWLGIFAYLSIIATGNVQHDYYQSITIPVVCLTLGRGAVALFDLLKAKFGQKTAAITVSIIVISSWFFAWQQVKGNFNINHWEYVAAGKAVDAQVPIDAKVIAPAFGDTMFLFQTNRTGWPIGFEIDQKIKLGATHYVSTSYDDEARMLEKNFKTVQKNEQFILIDLTQPISTDSAEMKL